MKLLRVSFGVIVAWWRFRGFYPVLLLWASHLSRAVVWCSCRLIKLLGDMNISWYHCQLMKLLAVSFAAVVVWWFVRVFFLSCNTCDLQPTQCLCQYAVQGYCSYMVSSLYCLQCVNGISVKYFSCPINVPWWYTDITMIYLFSYCTFLWM